MILGTLGVAVGAFVLVATLQASAVERKARGLRAGMSLGEVVQQLDGWRMINTHPMDSRAIPHGTGPEFNGYRGEMYVLTPVQPNRRETDLRKISRAEFMTRLETWLGSGKPWTVYFSYRTVPTHRWILVRFDGSGRTAHVSDEKSAVPFVLTPRIDVGVYDPALTFLDDTRSDYDPVSRPFANLRRGAVRMTQSAHLGRRCLSPAPSAFARR